MDQMDSLVSRDQKEKKEQMGREEKWVTGQFCQPIVLCLVPVTVLRWAALGSTAHRGDRARHSRHGARMHSHPEAVMLRCQESSLWTKRLCQNRGQLLGD